LPEATRLKRRRIPTPATGARSTYRTAQAYVGNVEALRTSIDLACRIIEDVEKQKSSSRADR